MNNDGKPTALANPNRMPPFAMAIRTLSRVDMLGGRASAEFAPTGGVVVEVGGDGYTALHQASSTNRNRDTGMLMMERLIWGDARLSTAGIFARLGAPLGPVTASGTMRLDLVRADADSAGAFFLENATGDLESTEANLSGAADPVPPRFRRLVAFCRRGLGGPKCRCQRALLGPRAVEAGADRRRVPGRSGDSTRAEHAAGPLGGCELPALERLR
jgi:hypothetical protein